MQRSSVNALLFAVKHWETKKFSCKKLLIKLRPSQSIQKPHNAYSLWTEREKTWCDLLIPSWEQAFPLIWNMCKMHIRPVHFGILSRLYANLKEEKPLIQKFVFNPIGWKFRPSHCWQQGWVQKNSCLLSWASSKYVREGERNEIKYSETAGSVGFVGGEQSGPWQGLWCPPCVTRPPPPWWPLRQPPRAPWARRRRRGRWWTTRGPRGEKTSCWTRTGERRFLITSRVLSSLSLSSLWDSLWRFYAF